MAFNFSATALSFILNFIIPFVLYVLIYNPNNYKDINDNRKYIFISLCIYHGIISFIYSLYLGKKIGQINI